MLESSFRLGSVAGIRIGVHYTWFIVFILLGSSLYLLFRSSQPEWGTGIAWTTAVITSLIFFASIILHELGHSLVALALGIRVSSITLFIFGGVAQTERDADSAGKEFAIAIAGPLVSFVLAGLFYLLAHLLSEAGRPAFEALLWLATINLFVAVFNLVPGFPLDGGRVLRAVVWGVSGNAIKGMNWAVVAGKVVAYTLMLMGVVTVVQTGLLINGLWFVGLGWFLLAAAEASGRSFTMQQVFGHTSARQVMARQVPRVDADTVLSEWMDRQVLTTGERAYLVDEDGRVVGLVTLSDCKKVPREQWDSVPVRRIMTPVERLVTVAPEIPIVQVLDRMQARGLNQVPVVEHGSIVGWIDRDRLLRILRSHMETGR